MFNLALTKFIAGIAVALSFFGSASPSVPQLNVGAYPFVEVAAQKASEGRLGANQVNFVAGKPYFLSGSGITSTATTISLTSFTMPVTDGVLNMGDFGAIGYGTIEPSISDRKEFISFTGVTQNANGSATLTGVTRGLSFVSPYTASTTLRQSHSGGSRFVISNPPQLYNEAAFKGNAETIAGLWTFPSSAPPTYDSNFSMSSTSKQFVSGIQAAAFANVASTSALAVMRAANNTFAGNNIFSDTLALNGAITITATTTTNKQIVVGYDPAAALEVATKQYVDGVSVAGAANSSETVKGISELATGAEAAAGTSAGGTSARLVLPASLATSTSQVAQNSIVITNTSGKIDPTFFTGTAAYTLGVGMTTTNSTTTSATTTNLSATKAVFTSATTTNLTTTNACIGCHTITRVTATNSSCSATNGTACTQTAVCAGTAIAISAGITISQGAGTALVEGLSVDGAQTATAISRNISSNSGVSITAIAMCLNP